MRATFSHRCSRQTYWAPTSISQRTRWSTSRTTRLCPNKSLSPTSICTTRTAMIPMATLLVRNRVLITNKCNKEMLILILSPAQYRCFSIWRLIATRQRPITILFCGSPLSMRLIRVMSSCSIWSRLRSKYWVSRLARRTGSFLWKTRTLTEGLTRTQTCQ